jgi:hypothetical protein
MMKKQKRKKQKRLPLFCMIVVGMRLLAIIFAAEGSAAVRRYEMNMMISH